MNKKRLSPQKKVVRLYIVTQAKLANLHIPGCSQSMMRLDGAAETSVECGERPRLPTWQPLRSAAHRISPQSADRQNLSVFLPIFDRQYNEIIVIATRKCQR